MEVSLKKYNLEHFQEKEWYSFEEIIDVIETLEVENKKLKEQIEAIEQDKEDNFRRISIEFQVDISDKDFI